MAEYRGNSFVETSSNKKKEQAPVKKEIKPVLEKNRVTVKKKSPIRKFMDNFIATDMKEMRDTIIRESIIPTVQKGIIDLVTNGLSIAFFGHPQPKKNKNYSSSIFNYSGCWSGGQNTSSISTQTQNQQHQRSLTMDEIEFETIVEANDVLEALRNWIEQYGEVSVAELYNMIQVTADYTFYNYGWKNLDNAQVVPISGGGFAIDFPRPMPLK